MTDIGEQNETPENEPAGPGGSESGTTGSRECPPPPPPPAPAPAPDSAAAAAGDKRYRFGPMDREAGFAAAFDTLLRRPGSLVFELRENGGRGMLPYLLLCLVGSLGVFGFLLGTFTMGSQLWAAPAKVVLGVLASGLICLPSLYIFSCLNGLEIRFASLTGLFVAALCLTSLILLGFAPVLWVFAQSTNSLVFMGILTLGFWMIALWFGLNLIRQAAAWLGVARRTHLRVWGFVFVLVTLQMSTTLRPLIGESDRFLTREKKSFVIHWFEEMGGTVSGRDDR